jgi:undecaprenyl-diphosphatase
LKSDHHLSRPELFALIAVIIVILVLGVVLYIAGHNESLVADSPSLRGLFEALTQLGNDAVYLVILCLVYLAYNKSFGRRLCYVFFMAVYATDVLKEFFHDPRPPANLLRDDPSTGYGFPSGHSTTSVAFYGYPMLSHLGEVKVRNVLIVLSMFAIITVPISRLVIGAHDLQDVVGGVVISLCILTAFMVLQPWVSRTLATWSLEKRIGVGAVGALLLWGIGGLVLAMRHPNDVGNAFEEVGRGGGLLLGCAVAFPLEEAYFDYRPELLSLKNRIMAAVVGLPITIGFYAVLKLVSEPVLPSYVGDLVTYTVLMIVLAFMIPFVLSRMLIDRGRRPPNA